MMLRMVSLACSPVARRRWPSSTISSETMSPMVSSASVVRMIAAEDVALLVGEVGLAELAEVAEDFALEGVGDVVGAAIWSRASGDSARSARGRACMHDRRPSRRAGRFRGGRSGGRGRGPGGRRGRGTSG